MEPEISEIATSYEWAKRVIDSCNNTFHLDCSRKVIELFKNKYGECDYCSELIAEFLSKESMIIIA